MIVRKFQWILLFSTHLLFATTKGQDATSYDTNDWIPITPTSTENTKKAQGRVLNLDSPNQNFFPENEYRKSPQTEQYVRESSFQKQPKTDQPYKFEPVIPLPRAQYVQQNQFIQPQQLQQYFQSLQQIPYVQGQVSQQLIAPPQQPGQNFYNPNKGQEYALPFNNSFYQSLNPTSINKDLIGAIKNQNPIEPTSTTSKPKEEKESIQLLYVPLENLKQNQLPVTQQPQPILNKPPIREEKNLQNHKQVQREDIENDFIRQALEAHKLQQQLLLGQPLLLQPPTTTPRPKKRKPHQPPLAVYMEKQGSADVKDVLEVLKNAKTIAVQDRVGPGSPQVFVGPSNLKSADGYVKFPLPYLSSVQGNRIERKVEQLPFFVAPLSYKTPEGYSKIPLPSPHVGSVVVSNKEELHEKHPEQTRQPQMAQSAQNQIVQDFDVKQPFPQYRQEVKPDDYLLQNPQQNPLLLGLGNEFLAGLRGQPQNYQVTTPKEYLAQNYQVTTPKEYFAQNYQQQKDFAPNIDYQQAIAPNYQQTPTKQFVPNNNYQLNLKDASPQYYQSTPSYETGEKSTNYQIPSYQTNLKEPSPTQISKEPITNYDIPSEPVESKTSFTPNYQLEAKPQFSSSVSPNYVTPKSQPNVYTYTEEPVRSTTTPQYKLVQNPQTQYIPNYQQQNPYRQAINQYEIQQINNQFGKGEALRTTTPVLPATENYDYDIPTTTTTRSRSRSRSRSRYTTTSTTPHSVSDEKYTVLEDFAIQPKTTTVKYTTEVETIPANVYKIQADKLEPVYIQNQPPVRQQEAPEPQVLRGRQNPEPVNTQEQVLRGRQNPEPVNTQEPLNPFLYNRGQVAQEQDQINPYLAGLINNLQDQAVRPLLVPNLLVPTTEKLTTLRPTTEEIITTTEAPRIETTTRRSRGRQRANSARYSTTSAPRRSNRRRPRPTTERQYSSRTTTEVTPTYEPTKRASNHRQRFRTRGRPAPSTERNVITTTENNFKQPPLEGGFQASSGEPQSYYQFDPVENQQVITVKPEPTSEEKPYKEYHQVYSLPLPTAERVPETTTINARPMVDVQITHTEGIKEPVSELKAREEPQFVRINSNIQSGGVIHNNRNEETTKPSIRIRTRSRGRGGRFSSTTARPVTTTTTTTTAKPKEEEEEEEFYGFIRTPNFQKPSPVVYTTTQQPVQVYSSSYQEPPRTLIQLEEEPNQSQESESSAPVHFVGEIRPKYTTTTTEEPSTEAPRFRTRARIRVPSRKATPQPSYNEVKSSEQLEDQINRRVGSTIRSRGRGKSHFKMPDNLTTKPDDHDVEGGNYPTLYIRSKDLTTEKPSGFQITIEPYEEEVDNGDQVPHSSLYSPTVIKNTDTQWVEASILPSPNELRFEDKQMMVDSSSSEEALTTETEESEEETTTVPPTTTEKIETTTRKRRKNGRRRGMWKLVRHRPVDSFETAESQNYHSVLNVLGQAVKERPVSTTTTTTTTTSAPLIKPTENSILDTLYNIFGLASTASRYEQPKNKTVVKKKEETPVLKEEDKTVSSLLKKEETPVLKEEDKTVSSLLKKEEITTTVSPTFPEEITEITTTEETKTEAKTIDPETITTTTTEHIVKNYEVEPWEMKEVKTSTSTEISRETEICFKGKCVKSKEEKDVSL